MQTTRFAFLNLTQAIVVVLWGAANLGLAQPPGSLGRRPAEWLGAIEEQAAAEKDSWDRRWKDVMRGAALAFEP